MAISGWHPRYSTGIKLIDEQHQEIFLALARLKTAVCMNDEGEDVGELLDYFDRLVRNHFTTEEDFMHLQGYPDLEAHRMEHRKALESLEEIQCRRKEAPESLVNMIVTFTSGWLCHHISEGDFKLVDFLKVRGGS
jgi:hemerythrin